MSEQEQNTENNEITETTEAVENNETVEETEEVKEEDNDELAKLKQENAKLNRLLNKDKKKKEPEAQIIGFDPKDMKALMDVHEDDWQELQDYAKFKNITIAEAKQNPSMAQVLKDNAEFRLADKAKNTSRTQKTDAVSGDKLNEELKKGNVPEKGSQEAEELFWARRGGRRG